MTRVLICLVMLFSTAGAVDTTGVAVADSVVEDTVWRVPTPASLVRPPDRQRMTVADSVAIETLRLEQAKRTDQIWYWLLGSIPVLTGLLFTCSRIHASREATREALFSKYTHELADTSLSNPVRIAAVRGLGELAGAGGWLYRGDKALRDRAIELLVESLYTESSNAVLDKLKERLVEIGGPALQPLVERHRDRIRKEHDPDGRATLSVSLEVFEASRDALSAIVRKESGSLPGNKSIRMDGWGLSDMLLSGANLRGARLRKWLMLHADLSEALLSHADLSGAILMAADLTGARLAQATFKDANLSGAVLGRSLVSQARDWKLAGTWSGANWWDAVITVDQARWFQEHYPSPAELVENARGEKDLPRWFPVLFPPDESTPPDAPGSPAT